MWEPKELHHVTVHISARIWTRLLLILIKMKNEGMLTRRPFCPNHAVPPLLEVLSVQGGYDDCDHYSLLVVLALWRLRKYLAPTSWHYHYRKYRFVDCTKQVETLWSGRRHFCTIKASWGSLNRWNGLKHSSFRMIHPQICRLVASQKFLWKEACWVTVQFGFLYCWLIN
jgi:hypothetical protein